MCIYIYIVLGVAIYGCSGYMWSYMYIYNTHIYIIYIYIWDCICDTKYAFYDLYAFPADINPGHEFGDWRTAFSRVSRDDPPSTVAVFHGFFPHVCWRLPISSLSIIHYSLIIHWSSVLVACSLINHQCGSDPIRSTYYCWLSIWVCLKIVYP